MLKINNNLRHDQFSLPNLVGIEANTICLYLQNHGQLLFVSTYLLPASAIIPADLDPIFSQNDSVVLVGDLNSKHVTWNNATMNRNGWTLLSYCINNDITLNYPDQPTHFPYNSNPSVLDLALSKRCSISKPQAVPALSSDHNPIVFKIHLHPAISKLRIMYDYKQANWSLFRATLDLHLNPYPHIHTTTDLEHAITAFETSVRQAAISAIPVHTVKRNHLTLPPNLCSLLKLKNHYRCQYQRLWLPMYYHLYQLFSQVFSTQLSWLWNTKWTSFLRTLHPQTSQFWKIALYFTNPTFSVPPLIQHGMQVFHTPLKAEVLARQFEQSHHLTLNMGTNNHSLAITLSVNRFFRSTTPKTPQLQLTNHYEVMRKILSLKPWTALGEDRITSLMLRNLSRKALTYLTQLFNHLLWLGFFPNTWKRAKVIPIPKPDKPTTDPNSYRPISLLSIVGKLFEWIIASHLITYVNQQHLLPHEQFGSRKKHSTISQLARISDYISNGYNLHKHSGTVLLDLEKAYDTVWIHGLLHKLIALKFPKYLSLFSGHSLKGVPSQFIWMMCPPHPKISPLAYPKVQSYRLLSSLSIFLTCHIPLTHNWHYTLMILPFSRNPGKLTPLPDDLHMPWPCYTDTSPNENSGWTSTKQRPYYLLNNALLSRSHSSFNTLPSLGVHISDTSTSCSTRNSFSQNTYTPLYPPFSTMNGRQRNATNAQIWGK